MSSTAVQYSLVRLAFSIKQSVFTSGFEFKLFHASLSLVGKQVTARPPRGEAVPLCLKLTVISRDVAKFRCRGNVYPAARIGPHCIRPHSGKWIVCLVKLQAMHEFDASEVSEI